jgi:voltage-gated potassium channel
MRFTERVAAGTTLAVIAADMDAALARKARFEKFVAMTELPITILALLIAPALVLEGHAKTAGIREAARAVNWIVWVAFCGEYVVKVALTPDRRRFVRKAWIDLLIVVLSAPVPLTGLISGTPARIVGLVRFVRGAAVAAMGLRLRGHILRPHRLHYAAVTTGMIIALGALGIFAVEHGINERIQTFGDALWWSVVTATTVGYGDVSPVTPEGRLIAVGLMLLGIAFIGVFTATISSYFFDLGRVNQVEYRLARIEAKLDALTNARV